MVDEQNREERLEDWLAEERRRLDEGFSFHSQPSPEGAPPDPTQDILAQMGLGAGVLASVVAGHPNPVTFEGCSAATIAEALESYVTDDETQVTVDRTEQATIVTLLQRLEHRPHRFSSALTVTFIETDETLTVAMSDLSADVKRGAISGIGQTALRSGQRLLLRRRGLAGVFDAAGGLLQGVEELSEQLEELSLPRQVWGVIDLVGGAAEEAYLAERRKQHALQRERETVERAWTHCEWCGRAYAEDEEDIVQCPSCGAPRARKPGWLG